MNDILLDTNAYAASALQHGYALFSYDRHFQQVDGLLVGATPTDLMLP